MQCSSESQTDKLTTGDTYTFIIYHLFTTNYQLLQANQNNFEYLTSIYSLTVFKNYAVRFTLNESVFMTNYIWNIWEKNEENNSGNFLQNILSMTSIWINVRFKLPTIKKLFLYWTMNWWIGGRCGNGFLLCTSAVFDLWRHFSQAAQNITCNIKWDKSASTQNW